MPRTANCSVGASEAVVLPMDDYLRLRAIERRASADEIEEAEIEAAAQAPSGGSPTAAPGRSPTTTT